MQVSNVTKTRRRLGAIALTSALSAVALVAGTISAAHALGTVTLDNVPLVDGNGDSYYLDATTVEAESVNLAANTDYYVGVCQVTPWPSGAPICSSFTQDTSDANGELAVDVTVYKSAANVHWMVPGHLPNHANIDCSAVDSCKVYFVDHDTRLVEDDSEPFYVQ